MMSNDPLVQIVQLRSDLFRELTEIRGDLYGDASKGKIGLLSRLEAQERLSGVQVTNGVWIIRVLVLDLIFSFVILVMVIILLIQNAVQSGAVRP